MKWCVCLFFCAVMVLTASCSSPIPDGVVSSENASVAEAGPGADLPLGAGDELFVSVWRNDDLNRTVTIGPSGRISFPLVGDIAVSGKSIGELREELAASLSRYLVDPQVDVRLVALRSRRVHVLGEVRTPGSIYLDRDLVIIDAIADAGGYTTDANKSRVLLVREEGSEVKVTALDVGIGETGRAEGKTGEYHLRSGDIIYVPPLKIASIERFMQRFNNIINPFISVERGISVAPEMLDALKNTSAPERDVIIAP